MITLDELELEAIVQVLINNCFLFIIFI